MNANTNGKITDYIKKRNFKRFSLFIVVAFVFLIFSKLSNDYNQTIKLKVKLVNLADEVILKNDSTNFINAYVEAKGFSLVPLIFKKSLELSIDAENDVNIKSNYFMFDVQKNKYLIESQLGKSYQLLSVMPDTLLISYSKRASKVVPIALKHNINYAVGYDLLDAFKFNADSVKIVGSSTEVSKIDSIITESLVLKDVKTHINSTVNLDVSDYNNIEVFPKYIRVTAKVARFTEGTVEVPIEITNQPNDVTINYFPKTVSVSYYVDLENYNDIKALDFKVECDYSEIEDKQTYFIPKVVKQPKFVKHINIKQKRIDFIQL